MRDQKTSNREAELPATPRIGSGDWLDPKIVNADCLIEMPKMPAQSVDAIISDLPYGTTQNRWDSVIPLAPLWAEWKRLLKPNGAIVLTACQPFTSVLVMSNLAMFKYDWCWEKTSATGHLNAKKMPMRAHESVLVFCDGATTYNPQKTFGHARKVSSAAHKRNCVKTECYRSHGLTGYDSTERYPRSVVKFAGDKQKSALHPTQKPVALMRYLVRTYTNPGDVVLDVACGSGTTCLAAMIEGRQSIGIEKDEQYAKIAINRIHEARGLGV